MGGQVGKGNRFVHGIVRKTAFVGKVFVALLERADRAAGAGPGSLATGKVGIDGRTGGQRQ